MSKAFPKKMVLAQRKALPKRTTPVSKWPITWRDWFATIAEIPWASLGVVSTLVGAIILFSYAHPFLPLIGDWSALLTFGVAATCATLLGLVACVIAFFGPTCLVAWYEHCKGSTVKYEVREWRIFIVQLWVVALASVVTNWKVGFHFDLTAEGIAFFVGLLAFLAALYIAVDGIFFRMDNGETRLVLLVTYSMSGVFAVLGMPIYKKIMLAASTPAQWISLAVLACVFAFAAANAFLSSIKKLVALAMIVVLLIVMFFMFAPKWTNDAVTLSKGVATTLGFRSAGPKLFAVGAKTCRTIENQWHSLMVQAQRIAATKALNIPIMQQESIANQSLTLEQTALSIFQCKPETEVSTIKAQIAWSAGSRWVLEFDYNTHISPEPLYLPISASEVTGL